MTATCHWAGEDACTAGHVTLKDIEDHLLAEHGDLVAQVGIATLTADQESHTLCSGGAGGRGGGQTG